MMHPRDETRASQLAAMHWVKANNALSLRSWKQKMRIKNQLWCFTFAFARGLKRLIDIVVSVTALVVLSPVLLLTAWAIYREDGGPIFFKQIRVGQQGRLFKILKFRSMVVNADAKQEQIANLNKHTQGVTFKAKNDPRITRVGAFIRKTSIDELPQLINVLKSEMALVGPRPPLVQEVAQYKASQLRRLLVKPGITCLWQIGGRANIDFEGQVRLDLQYIRSESIWQDLKILLLTIPAVVLSKGAY